MASLHVALALKREAGQGGGRIMKVIATCALTAVLLSLAAPAVAEDEVVYDRWYAQFHRGTKAGWAHHGRVRSERDGKLVIISESESEMVRGPGGELLKTPMRFSTSFVEDEDGAVLSYSTSADVGMGPQTRAGTVKDGVISVVEDGKKRSVAYPKGALGPAAVDRAVAAGLKAGAKIETVRFSPLDPDQGESMVWKVPETTKLVDVLGFYGWLYSVQMTDSSGIPETRLMDGKGGLWAGSLNLGLIRYFLTEEVVARADRAPTSFLTERIVAPDRAISAAAERTRVVLKLTRQDGPVGDLPSSNFQKVVPNTEDGTALVELSGGDPKGELVVWMRPYIGDDQDEAYLAGSPIVEIKAPRMKPLAESMVGPLKDGLSCARMLELRTKQYVRPSPASVGFATAACVISSRTGDSTETAILIVGLARALGLPARLVAGFTYWRPDQWPDGRYPKGAFAVHVWAEIYAGHDLWHPVDPMRMDGTEPKQRMNELAGHGGFGATHVAVLRSAGDTRQPFTDIVLPVLEFMNGLKIEVVEAK